jgi:UDP-N-acetylmuramoylalanine--D-glutamate ligase
MTPVTCFAGKTVALFGLGGSGIATAHALKAGGAQVIVWDDNAPARARAGIDGLNVGDLDKQDWSRMSSLILSPGIPLTHPKPHWTVERARAAGVEVIGDLELFCRERADIAPDAPFIAITGTNGKSTTTALTAHILREAGVDVQLGGNIGTPILALEPPSRERMHVIEVSSFQIDLAPSLNPTVGALINLSPDHLDRHGTMENYAAVKARLIDGSERALVGIDDEYCWRIGRERETRHVSSGRMTCPVSVTRELPHGVYALGTEIISTLHDQDAVILGDTRGISTLRGAHNVQNAAFAAGIVHMWQFQPDVIARGLRSYPGLPHRMEEVGRLGKVLFINDSKATNADATEKALLSFRDIFWIAGGQMKEGGIRPLMPLMDRVRKAYLIGAAANDFSQTLGKDVPHAICGTLEAALIAAALDAQASVSREPVVLLSPACASYDQFANYEARGDAFRKYVASLTSDEVQP